MILLLSALAASLLGLWFAWSRDLNAPAIALTVVVFALVFVIGRRIEAGRDDAWQQAAERVQGSFRPAPGAALLASFGPAPWTAWAQAGELQCVRAIEAPDADPPFALLQVRYPVGEPRGEAQPETWREATVAAVRISQGAPAAALTPVAVADGSAGAHNGAWGFVWRKGTQDAGASVDANELPALLEEARRALRPLSLSAPGPRAAPAGR